MAFNTIVILLNTERKELIRDALSDVLNKDYSDGLTIFFVQEMLTPYKALLEKLNNTCDSLILTSHTGAIDCLCYALRCTKKKEAEDLAFEIIRVNKQADMCKKDDHLTCTLNLSNQILTRLTYE